MTSLARQTIEPMTVDEFVTWDAPGPDRWQLIEGQAVAMAPASDLHGSIQAELIRLIANHLADKGSPCRVVTAPGVVPRVRSDVNFRVPDVGVTCRPVTFGSYIEDPVLLCEILSPSNEAEIRANVWTYCSIPSVTEILLLRSSRIEADLLRRASNGDWPGDPVRYRSDATLTLDSIGFSLPLAALYRTTGLVR